MHLEIIMSLLAKASAEGLHIGTVKRAITAVCRNQVKYSGMVRLTEQVKLKSHEMANVIANDIKDVSNSDIASYLKGYDIKDEQKSINKVLHENTQELYKAKHDTSFWFKNAKYVKKGSIWIKVCTFDDTLKAKAESDLKTKGFFLYHNLRKDVSLKLNVDLSQTLNEIIDHLVSQ